MKKISNLPSNVNTLFLRNLETILIFKGLCNSSQLEKFRNEIAPLVLDVLQDYNYAMEELDLERLQYQYIRNCISVRKHIDNLSQTKWGVVY